MSQASKRALLHSWDALYTGLQDHYQNEHNQEQSGHGRRCQHL